MIDSMHDWPFILLLCVLHIPSKTVFSLGSFFVFNFPYDIDWGMQMRYNLFSCKMRDAIFLKPAHILLFVWRARKVMTGSTDIPCWSARKMISQKKKKKKMKNDPKKCCLLLVVRR